MFAARMRAETREVADGHASFVTHTKEVAAFIESCVVGVTRESFQYFAAGSRTLALRNNNTLGSSSER
jgi:hypothetical protein